MHNICACAASQDFTILVLLGAAALSLLLGLSLPHEAGEPAEWIEGAAILASVLIVVTVSAATNYQKEGKFRELNRLKDDVKACGSWLLGCAGYLRLWGVSAHGAARACGAVALRQLRAALCIIIIVILRKTKGTWCPGSRHMRPPHAFQIQPLYCACNCNISYAIAYHCPKRRSACCAQAARLRSASRS